MSDAAGSPPAGATGNLVVDLQLTLSYRHGFGALSPFFQGLLEGRALASCCPVCGDVRFPPRLVCPHDGAATDWRALSGEGRLVSFTLGRGRLPLQHEAGEQLFGEVALDGASNRAFARIEAPAAQLRPGLRLRLMRPTTPPPHPIQALVFVPI